MNKPLFEQILRENRVLAVMVLICLVICAGTWYAALRQGTLLAQQQFSWNAKRRQAALRTDAQSPAQFQNDKEKLRELYSTIPYRYEYPRVISEILDFMALRGATPGPMQYKPRKTDLNGLIAYTMNCSATGNYPGLKRLIADLERLDGISTLDAVSFSNPEPAVEMVTLDLQLTVYLREGQP